MGLCRALNVLLGMSSKAGAIWLFDLSAAPSWRFGTMAAAGVGLYIMGVTRFARHETTQSARGELASSTLGFNLGLLLVAMVSRTTGGLSSLLAGPNGPYWLLMDADPSNIRFFSAAALWVTVVLTTNLMVWRAVDKGEPRTTQHAVKTCIVALIGLDAAVVAMVCGPVWAGAVLALLLPTLTLGRWVYST